MSDEWGPWIEHDGKGCPCLGQFVHLLRHNGDEAFVIAGADCAANGVDPNGKESSWVWINVSYPIYAEITRYRIRKPKGMAVIEGLLARLSDANWQEVPIEEVGP